MRRLTVLAFSLLLAVSLGAQTFNIPSSAAVNAAARKSGVWFAESFGTTIRTFGTPTPVTSGTLAFVSKTESGYVSYTTSTTISNVARLNMQVTELPVRTKWNPSLEMDVYTDASTITGAMYMFCLYGGSTPPVSATGTNAHYICFRYVDGTDANWKGVVCDGTLANQTVTDLSSAIAANTRYRLKFVVSGAGTSVQFFVNGTAVGAAATSHLPDTNTDIGVWLEAVNLVGGGGTARAFSLSRLYYEQD